MFIERAAELTNTYAKCPKCGNGYIRKSEGTMVIEDDTFIRTCKCGYNVKATVSPDNKTVTIETTIQGTKKD